MIESIKCISFQDSVECKSSLFQSKESFPKLNYTFNAGNMYGIVSDFGCGSWGMATCLGGRCSEYYTGKILLNGIDIPANQLSEYSGFVGESIFASVNSPTDFLTPCKCIEQALSIGKQSPYSVMEIKKIFCLSDERFERPLNYVSGEIWWISMAVNFALGKDIFCYPWLNFHDVSLLEVAKQRGIIDFLKKENKIIIVPSSQKRILKKLCDYTIIFKKRKDSFC